MSRARRREPVTTRKINSTLDSIAQLQIDSINVVTRAHYMPLFSRLGSYDTALLDSHVSKKHARTTEYWAHEASYVRSDLVPDLIAWQRRRWIDRSEHFTAEHHELSRKVIDYLRQCPGTTARELSSALNVAPVGEKTHWGWNWNDTKYVTESLFAQGKILSLGRSSQFERRFALASDVLPGDGAPVVPEAALERLILRSLRSQGIGTDHCIAEYFRLPLKLVGAQLEHMSQRGQVESVSVRGISKQCYLLPGTSIPRKIDDDLRLLSPFDSMVFNRRRLEAFFDFNYRVEIYVPQPQRRYGYYVYPILLGEKFVGRIDLKAERQKQVLKVQSVHYEQESDPEIERQLASELTMMASWLGLDEVEHKL
ncbi:winged helix-turn-helix domain-containing protein [Glutamicibacter uratoxydans]|uniref:winged helix-turn-helix domain-containing protein n=1 Tax=Glutamicibacter uratoxydans TaxID=43667 RepID=UPI001C3FC446|nr:crosslink repair DNA glycosylase YcaQ family protein [Glutamicibacter uratoxydans]